MPLTSSSSSGSRGASQPGRAGRVREHDVGRHPEPPGNQPAQRAEPLEELRTPVAEVLRRAARAAFRRVSPCRPAAAPRSGQGAPRPLPGRAPSGRRHRQERKPFLVDDLQAPCTITGRSRSAPPLGDVGEQPEDRELLVAEAAHLLGVATAKHLGHVRGAERIAAAPGALMIFARSSTPRPRAALKSHRGRRRRPRSRRGPCDSSCRSARRGCGAGRPAPRRTGRCPRAGGRGRRAARRQRPVEPGQLPVRKRSRAPSSTHSAGRPSRPARPDSCW